VSRDITARRQAEEALRTRTLQVEALREVGIELTRELDLTRLLTLINQRAAELVGAVSGVVYLWDEAAQVLYPQVWLGYGDWMAEVRLRLGEGITGTVAVTRQGMILNDYRTSPIGSPLFLERTGITATVSTPLLYRDRLIGVLSLNNEGTGRDFTEDDLQTLTLFAAQCAIALENARLHEAALRRGAELEALLTATRSVMSGLDLQGILDRIVEQAQQIADAPHVKVLLLDRPARVLRVGAARGTAHRPGETLPLDTGLSAIVARSGEPLYSPQCAEDPRNPKAASDGDLGIQTYLGLPIKKGAGVLGVLTFNTTTPKAYTPAELAYLASFADQAALAIENARLYDDLRHSYAALEQAQAERLQSEKLRALGQMSAGIAHDLNNTLAAVLGQAELLKLRVSDPEIRAAIATLVTAATDGAHVVRRLQDFSRQRGSALQAPVDLTTVVQQALELTRPRWKDEAQRRSAPIEVRTRFEECPPVQGHAADLREALLNLIVNALDAMPTGGTLTVTTRVFDPAWVELAVSDTGGGMTEEVRRRIFEPFFTTKGLQGTGLGLSVVYGIVERHGGQIIVDSTPGQGTTVSLRLSTTKAVPITLSESDDPTPVASRVLLLIDDEVVVRQTLGQLLRAVGHTILEADSGPQGLAILQTHAVHCVLTDLGMPEMTGWEVARAVKESHPTLPVLLLTGWGESQTANRPEEGFVDRILGKPVRLVALLAAIAELTGPSQPRVLASGATNTLPS
jgi:signal transduction histidine kinase/CheY-like chemotaxis protein